MACSANALLLISALCLAASATVTGYPQIAKSDKKALEAVKKAITHNGGNFPSIECGNYTIACDNSGRVSTLVLFSLNFTGKIAPEIGKLTKLTFLDLSYNNFSGRIPESIGKLTRLTHLDFSVNLLSGRVPSSIGKLTRLTTLYLYANGFVNLPESLGDLKNLATLFLFNNKISGSIPWSIGKLTNLQDLWLFDNKLSEKIPYSIGKLVNLQKLILSDNKLSGGVPWSIGKMTSLGQLQIDNNRLSGKLPSSMKSLSTLYFISISTNYFSGTIPNMVFELGCVDLAKNCFFGESLPSTCLSSKQRTKTACNAYCNATQVGGACGGHGTCSKNGNGTIYCSCDEGYSDADNSYICIED